MRMQEDRCSCGLLYVVDMSVLFFFFFSSRRRHTRYIGDWSSDVCSSDLVTSPAKTRRVLRRNRAEPSGWWQAPRRSTRRSEERRVGKECRSRWSVGDEKEKSDASTVIETS